MTYLLAAVLLFLLGTGAGAATPTTGGVQVRVVPSAVTASVGSSVDVTVQADSVADLGGFQFQYSYDYMRLQVESVTVNPAFDQVVRADAIPAVPSETVAAAVYDNPPVTGTGVVLATIRFRVLIASSSPVSLSGVVLGKVGGTEIPSVAFGGSVTGNNPPVANVASFATTPGVPVSGTLTGSDADGNTLTFAIAGQGSLGSAIITDPATGAFTYTPNAGASGVDTFTFTVNDGFVGSAPAGVTVSIVGSGIYPVSVASAGTGAGTIASGDGRIACGTLCSTTYATGSAVDLTATPNSNSIFTGWSGDCVGTTPTITVNVGSSIACTANFTPAAPPAPRLSLPVDKLFFSSPGAMEVKIANAGTASLTVSSFAVTGADSASFTVASAGSAPCGATLAVGVSCSYVITFAPVVPGDPTGRGYFSGRLEIATDDPTTPLAKLTVSGASGVTMPEPVAFDVLPADWSITDGADTGSVWRQGLGSPTNATGGTGNFILADGYPGCTATVTDLLTGPVDFSAVATPITARFRSDLSLGSGGSATVDITTDGGASWSNAWTAPAGGRPGPRIETMDITAVAAGKPSVGFRFRYSGCGGQWEIDDAATGDFIQVATPSTTAEDFGALQAGTSSPARTITLANTGTVDLGVQSVVLAGTDVAEFGLSGDTCSAAILPPGGSCAFAASFTPTASGTKSASAEIRTDDPRNPLTAVKLTGLATLGPPGTFRIAASAGTGGTISPSGAVDVAAGGIRSFTIAALPGYHLRDVVVDGASVGFATSFTFPDLRSDHTISAFFAAPDGDANGDGVSDISDVVIALRIAVGALPATPEMLLHIDAAPLVVGTDGNLTPMPDGKIDVGDAIVLLRRSVGLIAW